ncbi:hypothetical protein GF318_05565 [Candidatus Micrarchaeota archaeon]|nr:hypothetical protein [Candidatus Micrarchaeota archaeon]
MNDFLSHVKGVLYRNLVWAYRSPFRLADVFIWPLVMLFTLTFFLSTIGGDQQLLGLLVLSVICWRAIFFVTFETTAAFIEEHWDRSLPNLLVSPISTLELALGGAITGMAKSVAVAFLCLGVGLFFYGYNLMDTATFAIAFMAMLVAGFSLGFMLFGLACYFEKRNIFTLSFLLPELVGLLSGPYYMVEEVFPDWAAAVLNTFPTTHAFNAVKSIFGLGHADYLLLALTSLVWVAIALAVNRLFYNLGRMKGTLTKVG